MKILLSAYACEPNKGSEPEVGWKWAINLVKAGHEVYVVTRFNNKKTINKYLKNKNILNLNFIYFDYPKWFVTIIKGKKKSYSYLYFILWQLGICFKVKEYVKKINFNYIHHVTFVSCRIPSFLCLYNIPFIFGPISGGDTVPLKLRKNFSLISKTKEYLRDLSNLYLKISPLMNLVFSRAKFIYVNSNATKKIIPKIYHHKVKKLLAIAVDYKKDISKKRKKKKNNIFSIIFAGNILEIKGIFILIKVFSKLIKNNYKVKLNIIGNGNFKKKTIEITKNYGIYNKIKFTNKINQKKLFNDFIQSDLLLMPALRDSGGFVVLEALSNGLPVATLNLGGPGEIINNKCGIKINVINKDENFVTERLYKSIAKLISNKKQYQKIKNYTKKRTRKFLWQQKINKIYK